MVFRGAKLCVFVDGDFWHGRDWPHLRTKLQNRANPSYWIPKIARNRERDEEQEKQLRQLGWTVFRLWETDILKDPDGAADQVMAVLEETRGMLNAST
jgi:DNA mismatch endonuclease (patch repair protein)